MERVHHGTDCEHSCVGLLEFLWWQLTLSSLTRYFLQAEDNQRRWVSLAAQEASFKSGSRLV